jgi:SAP domain-containing ribonucleoprotein
MSDYDLKNAELVALLKERGLPHTGKKAEMVARLQEDDKSKEGKEGGKSATAEDEIDWDDDTAAQDTSKPAQTSTQPAQPPTATMTSETAPNPDTAVSTTEVTTNAPVENDIKLDESGATTEKTPVDFSMGLAEATLDEEIEKRKARAKKFGMQENDPLADEALRRLERAKKFGEADGPRGLNEALPDRRPKRGRDGNDDRGDYKRRGGRGGRGGRRFGGHGIDRGDDRRRPQPSRGEQSNGGSWMSEKERAAADARKARFAT